jgi:hypothetical protein
VILFLAAALVQTVVAQDSGKQNKISYVLLVSIDGMHAVDWRLEDTLSVWALQYRV